MNAVTHCVRVVTALRKARLITVWQDTFPIATGGGQSPRGEILFPCDSGVSAARLAAEAPVLLFGEIKVDESYFGGALKGQQGVSVRSWSGGRWVNAATIPNSRWETSILVIPKKIGPDSFV